MSLFSLALFIIDNGYSNIINCNHQDCQCAANNACTIKCIGDSICQGQSLTCKPGHTCTIACYHKSSCNDAILNGAEATDVTVICDGEDACKGNTQIYCGSGDCSLQCSTSGTSCDLQTQNVHADSSNTRSFQCNGGECPSYISDLEHSPHPTKAPTLTPTKNPTFIPTSPPTSLPTIKPTHAPTIVPSTSPITNPTVYPTFIPTDNPSETPTVKPTRTPLRTGETQSPSHIPTENPTINPSISPSTSSELQVVDATTNNPTPTPIGTRSTTPNPLLSWITKRNMVFGAFVLLFVCLAALFCLVVIIIKRRRHHKQTDDHSGFDSQHHVNMHHFGPSNIKLTENGSGSMHQIVEEDSSASVNGEEDYIEGIASNKTGYDYRKVAVTTVPKHKNYGQVYDIELTDVVTSTEGVTKESMSEDSTDIHGHYLDVDRVITPRDTVGFKRDVFVRDQARLSNVASMAKYDEEVVGDDDDIMTKGESNRQDVDAFLNDSNNEQFVQRVKKGRISLANIMDDIECEETDGNNE